MIVHDNECMNKKKERKKCTRNKAYFRPGNPICIFNKMILSK